MPSTVITKAVLIGPDGKVLVLRREPNDPDRPGEVDFPGGSVEPDESDTAAMAREIREEAGLVVSEEALQLGYAYTAKHRTKDIILTRLLYIAHLTVTEVSLSHEHDAYWWRDPAELPEIFADTSWAVPLGFLAVHQLLT